MRKSLLMAALFPALALAVPPGTPMSEFGPSPGGPSQVALGIFFDHSGQDVFEEVAPSVLNTTGLSLEYAPWPYMQVGLFGGAAEFDVAVPDSRAADTSVHAFNTGFQFYAGVSGKLATPRVLSNTSRLVAFGSIGYLNNEDEENNIKRGGIVNAGASVQYMLRDRVNFVLGGEFMAMVEGEQESDRGTLVSFGISEPSGPMDYMRGLVGVEYFFKGPNRPFISLAFRPTGALGYEDKLGLRSGSIGITLGAIATLPSKGKTQIEEEEPGLADE